MKRSSARELDVRSVLHFNEGEYEGEVEGVSGLPSGQGIYRYHSGDVYTGSFLNNQRHGYGKMVFKGELQTYEGHYKLNIPSGAGRLKQANGDEYVGNFSKGLYSGQGKLTYANGHVYQGAFKRGQKHGFGRFVYANGDIYEGWFRREVPHGFGKLTFRESGYVEEGQFYRGKLREGGVSESEAKDEKEEDDASSEEEREEEGSSDEDDAERAEAAAAARAELLRSTLSPSALEAIQLHLGGASSSSSSSSSDEKNSRSPPPAQTSSTMQKGKSVHLTTAKTNADFKEQSYWDGRFEQEEEYDWLLTFEQLAPQLLPLLPAANKNPKLLLVGCGNSSFSADLYDHGYTNITNIDYSQVVIDKMRAKHQELRPLMQWLCMDMTRLGTFPDQHDSRPPFDVVIDKAAMDALMVDEGDVWNPKESVCAATHNMCLEMRRVLASSGVFLQISFAQPHFRTKYLMGLRQFGGEIEADPYSAQTGRCELYDWTLTCETVDVEAGCLSTFLYSAVCPDWHDPRVQQKVLTRREKAALEKSAKH